MFSFRTFAPVVALGLLIQTAQAQEIDMSPPGAAASPSTSSAPAPVSTGDDAAFHKGTLGLSLPFTLLSNIASGVGGVAERVQTIDLVYFVNDQGALDLIGGFNFHRKQGVDTAGMTVDTNLFGFTAGIGYRMYSAKGGLRAFIEPQLILSWPDTSDSDTFSVEPSVQFGVERNLSSWFSFSGAVGAGLAFANSFNDIQLATTASLAANLYWR